MEVTEEGEEKKYGTYSGTRCRDLEHWLPVNAKVTRNRCELATM
jgi:hypothetical protein